MDDVWASVLHNSSSEDTEELPHEDFWRAIPWAASLLSDPTLRITRTSSRREKPSGEDSFIGTTLRTDKTIRKWLSLFRQDLSNPSAPPTECLVLFEFGNGVHGYPQICHGGFVATLLDEILGLLLGPHMAVRKRVNDSEREFGAFTAYLNVSYKKPTPAPAVLLGRGKVTKVEGKKLYAVGTLEDGNGMVYAQADGLFVEPRAKI